MKSFKRTNVVLLAVAVNEKRHGQDVIKTVPVELKTMMKQASLDAQAHDRLGSGPISCTCTPTTEEPVRSKTKAGGDQEFTPGQAPD